MAQSERIVNGEIVLVGGGVTIRYSETVIARQIAKLESELSVWRKRQVRLSEANVRNFADIHRPGCVLL